MSWSDAPYAWYSDASDYSNVQTDDARRCQVEGCYKKHAFVRLSGNRKVYSKFCAEHTCARTYPEEEGFHCGTPRKASERYCPDHLKCGEPGCDKLGEFVGVREYIPWFCTQHRCTAPDCRLRATDSRQQRCGGHYMLCIVPDCARPAHLHRDGRLDLVCAVHYGTFRCVWTGCARRTGSNMRYCPSHKCTVADCTAGHDPTGASDACSKHRCTTPSCPHPVLYPSRPRSLHCTLHTCRVAGCVSPRATATGPSSSSSSSSPSSDFCLAHTCLTPHCTSESRASDAHCARHACSVPSCPRPRLSADPAAGSVLLSPTDPLYRDRCAVHARARERRAVSIGRVEGLDVEGLRERFELPVERERKRLSDDLEGLRRREREREREREVRREELERLRRGMEGMGRW